ncbi:N-acetlytransferase [Vairimorpha necatrix]|uniref:N-acetlytransferase n=1 Tax=Vairimorpha necatrix TaxID=6039 RepID=A0AAX4JB91_9MICR
MYTVNPLMPDSLFKLDQINLDGFSESFTFDYYLYYLKNHTEDCFCVSNESGIPIGYVLSKLELHDRSSYTFNNHLSAISVAPNFRRYKLGSLLMNILEDNGNLYNCKFVDLFVRVSNTIGISFYKNRGYVEYRRIFGYYNDDEDAFDMRKSLIHDKEGKYMEKGEDINVEKL